MAPSDPPNTDDTLSPPEDAASDEFRDEVGGQPADQPPDEESAGYPLGGETEEEKKEPLDMEVEIDQRSTCERHLAVTISRADIDRYYNKEFRELMTSAEVPGFRPGHVPRKVVETRFRKDVTERVKGSLLMDSLEQINEEHDL